MSSPELPCIQIAPKETRTSKIPPNIQTPPLWTPLPTPRGLGVQNPPPPPPGPVEAALKQRHLPAPGQRM